MCVCGYQLPAGADGGSERESRLFPEEGKEEVVLSMGLTQDFLIYCTQVGFHSLAVEYVCLGWAGSLSYSSNLSHVAAQNGCLRHFFLEDWQYVNEYRHVVGKNSVTHHH